MKTRHDVSWFMQPLTSCVKCLLYGVMAATADLLELGETLRQRREQRAATDRTSFSVRSLASRIGVSATYLSGIERGHQRPTEALLRQIAQELAIEPEPLLAMAGRAPEDVMAAIAARPVLAETVRVLRDLSDDELRHAVRRIRDGEW